MLSVLAALVICVGYVCVVVLGVHLVLLVLAALVCVEYICVYCGAWSAPGSVSACCTCHLCWLCVCCGLECTWCCQCLLHLSYVLAICVVVRAHLVLSVLAALVVCVGYM